MHDSEVEKFIAKPRENTLTMEILDKIDKKKDYPFLTKYIKSNDPDIRNAAIVFIGEMKNPKYIQLLFFGLRDIVTSNRALAAAAIYELGSLPKEYLALLFEEIKWQNDHYMDESSRIIDKLILSIGINGEEKDKKMLVDLQKTETSKNIREVYQLSLARIGDESSIDKFMHSLQFADHDHIIDCLVNAKYINNKIFIPIIIPILSDKTVVSTWMSHDYDKRACDFALETLSEIDPVNVNGIKAEKSFQYSDKQLEAVKNIYKIANK